MLSFAAHNSIAVALASGAMAADRPQRIVSLIPATTEMLFAMGAGDRVVAVSSYYHSPRGGRQLATGGASLDPNVERILSLKPHLVILYATQADLKTELDRARILYYSYALKGLPDSGNHPPPRGARRIAGRSQRRGRADHRQLADIRRRTAGLPHPKTLLLSREPGSLRNIDASGGDGFLHDMLEVAGGADVLADLQRQSVTMSTEMVLARAPEVIIEVRSPTGATSMTSDLSPWNTLPSVPAVRSHRVFSLVGDESVIPGPRVVAGTERLASVLHPDTFK